MEASEPGVRFSELALNNLAHIDALRRAVGKATSARHKAEFGQFMTPQTVAGFMAEMFGPLAGDQVRLLDAGAGIGSLSCAFLERCVTRAEAFGSVAVDAFEVDEALRLHLAESLLNYANWLPLDPRVEAGDFIEQAVDRLQFGPARHYTHAILNPPYRKIASASRHRKLLREVGIETVNLYSAFVALALALMAPGGLLVAIIPRSFCNGPYYRPFREFLLARAAIRHIHLFESRDKAFSDDDVLQENIIICLERGGRQGEVRISMSADDRFEQIVEHAHAFERIVFPDDRERFIHVPHSPEPTAIEARPTICCSLADLGLDLSTGPVVDFRVRDYLRAMPESGSAPLLYPGHFVGQDLDWPKPGAKKPNAIMRHAETDKWLYPNGYYTIVRRFSAKEEKRRIVAGVVDPAVLDAPLIGFENHLNVFHCRRQALPEVLARGLAVFLNSTMVDEAFRRFNGHTQVNATDLRLMKYPSREMLIDFGEWAKACDDYSQEQIDKKVETLA